jgi:hypothetical protein
MGLGPPVCLNCRVVYSFKLSYGWECPICKQNNHDRQGHLFTCDISKEELEGNLRFFNFVKGIDDASIDF